MRRQKLEQFIKEYIGAFTGIYKLTLVFLVYFGIASILATALNSNYRDSSPIWSGLPALVLAVPIVLGLKYSRNSVIWILMGVPSVVIICLSSLYLYILAQQ